LVHKPRRTPPGNDLERPGISLPSEESQTPHYFFQLASLLKSRQEWPESFEQALLAVEEMADRSVSNEAEKERGSPSRSASEKIEGRSATECGQATGSIRLLECPEGTLGLTPHWKRIDSRSGPAHIRLVPTGLGCGKWTPAGELFAPWTAPTQTRK